MIYQQLDTLDMLGNLHIGFYVCDNEDRLSQDYLIASPRLILCVISGRHDNQRVKGNLESSPQFNIAVKSYAIPLDTTGCYSKVLRSHALCEVQSSELVKPMRSKKLWQLLPALRVICRRDMTKA